KYTGTIVLGTNGTFTFKARVLFNTSWSGMTSGTFTVVPPTTGAVAGVVFRDTDGDGFWDSNETAMSGVRVFVDANNNGLLDSGEVSVLSDASGNWSFNNLAAGTYQIRIVRQAGWMRTMPANGYYTVTLTTGTASTNRRFGQRRV